MEGCYFTFANIMSGHDVKARVFTHPTFAGHLWETLVIAWPVILSQLSHTLVGVADTVFVGQTGSATNLATISFATSIYVLPLVAFLGVSMGLTTLVSNLSGSGANLEELAKTFWASLILNAVVSLALFGLYLAAFPIVLHHYPQIAPSAHVLLMAKPVLFNFIISLVPLALFQTCKQWLEGMGKTFQAMAVSIAGNVINIGLNYVLVYGHMGFEPMGARGSSMATLVARILMSVALALYIISQQSFREALLATVRTSTRYIRQLWNLGMPISLQMSFEVAAFAGAALLMGQFGEVSIASHQVAISMASLTYMAASGIASATTVRVGFFYGARQAGQLSQAANAGLLSALIFMGSTSIIIAVLNAVLPTLYSPDLQIQGMAAQLLLFAAAFQLADGAQVVCLGILRGLTDVKTPTLITLMSYWVVAIPLAMVLGFSFKLQGNGIWFGLNIGLYMAAILLYIRYLKIRDKLNVMFL